MESDHSLGESDEEYLSEDSNMNALSSGEEEEEYGSDATDKSANFDLPKPNAVDDDGSSEEGSDAGDALEGSDGTKIEKICETVQMPSTSSKENIGLHHLIRRDPGNMKRMLAKYTNVNRISALEYYQQRQSDKIPRPAADFCERVSKRKRDV